MKRIKRYCLLMFVLFASVLFSGCESLADFSKLPSETQSGKQTFGCMVDGKMFFGGYYAPFGHFPLEASCLRKSDKLEIATYRKIGEESGGRMILVIDNPKINIVQTFETAYYRPKNPSIRYCFAYRVENGGISLAGEFWQNSQKHYFIVCLPDIVIDITNKKEYKINDSSLIDDLQI